MGPMSAPGPAGRESLALPPPIDTTLLVVALTGVSFSGPLMAATAAPALAIAFWRNALGVGATAGAVLVRGRRDRLFGSARSLAGAALAGVALAAHFATWVPSVTLTSVASATALVSTQTVFTAVIAHAQGRRLPRPAWVGIALATVATGLITGADVGSSARALTGDLLAVAGGLCAAIYLTIGARVRTSMTTASYTVVCYAVCSGLLLLVCLVGAVPLRGFSGNAWLKIALVTVCAQLLGHSLFNVVLRSTSATVIGLAILLEVPGAAIVAYVWLGQHPPITAVPGLVLLLAGLALVARAGGRDLPVEITE
jgi:drug/metabolite transporter (DMT)-like permease